MAESPLWICDLTRDDNMVIRQTGCCFRCHGITEKILIQSSRITALGSLSVNHVGDHSTGQHVISLPLVLLWVTPLVY